MRITRGDIFYILPPEGTDACGSEQTKGRPGIVVSNNSNNTFSTVVEVVYLTRQEKKPLPTHVTVDVKGERSTVLCEQIDSISVERLDRHIGHIKYKELREIEDALKVSLALDGR